MSDLIEPRVRFKPGHDILHKYGLKLDAKYNDIQLELKAFCLGWPEEYGGLGKFGHCRRGMEMLYPRMQWNPWLERMFKAFCNEDYAVKQDGNIVRVVSLVGVAAAGKTFATGRYAHFWWLAAPNDSIVILTSTSKLSIGQRVWPVIQSSYYEAREAYAAFMSVHPDQVQIGNLIDSRKILQATKGDEKHAIFAQSVKDGETAKAEAFIRGQHACRILISIDEAGETPEAIYGAISNMRKGCFDLTIIISDNSVSRLNPHGRCCAPRGGWKNRIHAADHWPTEGVPEWQIDPGVCHQFRGADSPNVIAGRTLYPYLYTWEDYKNSQKEGIKNSLRYWRYDAGEWAPDGVSNTVFNEVMAMNCQMQEGVTFLSFSEPISFLDPAYGGDDCIQCIGRIGDVEGGRAGERRLAILIEKMIPIGVEPGKCGSDGKEIDVITQIAMSVIANCKIYNVQAKNFGLFTTGAGIGVASRLFTDWSNEILQVEEGGRPSDLPASLTDSRPAKDVYDRKVTELWFSAREFALGHLLRGVDNTTLIELCMREFETVGKPWKYCIEKKEDFRPKLGKSPDRADSLCGLVELARVRWGALGGGEVKDTAGMSDAELRFKTQQLEAEPAYSEQADREEVLYHEGLALG